MSGRIAEFRERNSEVLGISTDSIEMHERWLATPTSQGGRVAEASRVEVFLAPNFTGAFPRVASCAIAFNCIQ